MKKKTKSDQAQYQLGYLLQKYSLPLAVRKNTWYGDFYFSVENVDRFGGAKGKRYCNGEYYDDYSALITDLFCLYGENNKKKALISFTGKSVKAFSIENPNKLDLNKDNYIKGITKLFIQRDSKLYPATFDHFDTKNGKDVIFVVCDGRKSFYSFPQTTYVFPNKDDGNDAISRANRSNHGTGASKKIVYAYKSMPRAQVSSSDKDMEFAHEKGYHFDVDSKLLANKEIQKGRLEDGKRAMRRAREEYTNAFIDARENGCLVDDHASISYQLNSAEADKVISLAQRESERIEVIRQRPYFARVDCGPSISDLHTAYLGENDIPGYVVSWRNSEIGNAYYHSSVLQARDDIVIALKRIVDIENACFKGYNDEINIFSSGAVSEADIRFDNNTDALLVKLLKMSRSDKKTHDIIKTIQSEQYDIITSDFGKNALINGCAGSGKTMIMYHRLSYIAYNYEAFTKRRFDPNNVYVITPSSYFDLSNNELLKQLTIDTVHNSPMMEQIGLLISKHCSESGIVPLHSLGAFCKGGGYFDSDKLFGEDFEDYFAEVEDYCSSEQGLFEYRKWAIGLANDMLISQGFLPLEIEESDHSYEQIIKKFNSERYYFNTCFTVHNKNSNFESGEKYFSKTLLSGISYLNIERALELSDKTGVTYKTRKKRLEKHRSLIEAALSVKPKTDMLGEISSDIGGFWNLVDNATAFEKLLTVTVAEKIISNALCFSNTDSDLLLRCLFAAQMRLPEHYLKNGYCSSYFLSVLNKKFGAVIDGESFVFIDEYQNYSPFELCAVKNAYKHAVFNLYGDFDQRIEKKGSTLKDNIKSMLEPDVYNINVNYRNAKQITAYINKAVNKNMQSIGVDGCVYETDVQKCLFEINNRTAIIAKDISFAKYALKLRGASNSVNDVSASGEILSDAINLIDIFDCKGLEFDTVYVFDFNMNENEKYVAYTRAMDNLIVIKDDLALIKQMEEERKEKERRAKREQELLEKEKEKANKKDTEAFDDDIEHRRLEDQYNDQVYYDAIRLYSSTDLNELKCALTMLNSIADHKDAKLKISAFESRIALLEQDDKKSEYRAQRVCQHCGGKFKGIFRRVCSICGKRKDY